MRTQHTPGWQGGVMLGVWFGLLISLLGAVQGQAQPAERAQPAAALEEAKRLDEQISKLYGEGKYSAAIPLAQRALALREQGLGPAHPSVATSLNNLAALYKEQGGYEQAEFLYQRGLALREQVLGPMHPDVAISLNNLALLYQAQGAYGQAEPLLQRALGIVEQTRGPTHHHVAIFLDNLAALYRHRQSYKQAELLYQRALTIFEQRLGPRHPDIATSLNNLAALYQEQGGFAQAEPLLRRALAILAQRSGPMHPNVVTALNNLALLYEAQGDVEKAIVIRHRRNELREQLLGRLLGIGTEAEKRAYLATLAGETWTTVSLHTQSAPHHPDALRLALTTMLRRKGRVLDTMTATLDTLRRRLGPAEQNLLEPWAMAHTQLATLVRRGPGPQDPAAYRQQRARLEAQAQELEAQLSSRSAAFRTQTVPVTLTEIQQALPAEAALIEVVWYRLFQPRAALPVERWGAPHYVAYVLRHQGEPQWVDLGETAPIDREVVRLRRELSCTDDARGVGQDAEQARQRCLARLPQVRTYARQLDEKVMRPLRPLLGDARLVLLVPDGTLNLLPFGALVDEQQHYLLERFTFSYLTTGRDLLRLQTKHPSQQGPLVLANPIFDADGPPPALQMAVAESRSPSLRSADFATMRFEPLPGTADEAHVLQLLLPGAQVLTGAAATEAALKQGRGPRLLHVATHGFFLPDQPPLEQREGVAPVTASAGLSPHLWAEHPLLRSGLALAGANARQSGAEDGVLTALEATGLDLQGTQLVVLSACETGIGEVQNGEGVYGLRRALVMAGAESQVMSLWKVDDDATRALMMLYYTQLLAGDGRAEALRQAQLALLTRAEQRHPFFWASFIPSGEWRPLEGWGELQVNPGRDDARGPTHDRYPAP